MTERLAGEMLSLSLFPELSQDDIERVACALSANAAAHEDLLV